MSNPEDHPVIAKFHKWVRAHDPDFWRRHTAAYGSGGREAANRIFNSAFAAFEQSQSQPSAAAGLLQAIERHNSHFH
jgi:hypothetical protein